MLVKPKREVVPKSVSRPLLILLAIAVSLGSLQAQKAIVTAGAKAIGGTGSASYSVGQVFYAPIKSTGGIVEPGVQQSYAVSVINSVDDAPAIDLVFSVYPNPVTESLQLTVDDPVSTAYFYQLFNLNGQLIIADRIRSGVQSIPVSTLAAGAYILKVSSAGKELKSFRIIKK